MEYKILRKYSTPSNSTTSYWTFVKVDATSTTDFSANNEEDLETKLKELLETIPSGELLVVSPNSYNIDILFS